MKRREFIALVAGAFAWPIALKAQQPGKIYRLGLFSAGSRRIAPNPSASPFIGALRDLGWIEGKNIIVEERFADDQLDRFAGRLDGCGKVTRLALEFRRLPRAMRENQWRIEPRYVSCRA